VKVKLKVLPGVRGPELNAPLSAVTVWVTVSLFVQLTFVPTFTVRDVGLKAKFLIDTLLPVLVGAVVGVGVGVGAMVGALVGVAVGTVVGVLAVVVVVVPPQAARSTTRHRASRHSQAFVVVCA
jgi:cell shape-determining protein MreD